MSGFHGKNQKNRVIREILAKKRINPEPEIRTMRPYYISFPLFISLLGLCLLSSPGEARGQSHFGVLFDTPMAYVLPKGRLEVTPYYEAVNSAIDVFNFRDKEEKATGTKLGTFGDYSAKGLMINFGLFDRATFHFNGQCRGIDYSRDTMDIESFNTSLRYNFYAGNGILPTLAIEPHFYFNRGHNISYSGTATIKKTGEGWGIEYGPFPYSITAGGLKDKDWGFSLLASKRIYSMIGLNLFYRYDRITVGSEIKLSLPADLDEKIASEWSKWDQIKEGLTSSEYKETDHSLGVGLIMTPGENWIISGSYRFVMVSRDIDDIIARDYRTNNILKGRITYFVSSWMGISLDATYFSNRLIGEIPFLYNSLTAHRYDRPYGFAGLSITFLKDYF